MREADAELDAAVWRAREDQRREHNSRAWLAWHVAALQRIDGQKVKFPKLESMMVDPPKERRTPSWQESHAAAMAWATKGK